MIRAECDRRGWDLAEIVEDAGLSGKSMARPGLGRVLDTLRKGEANVLMAAKLDRLSRSTRDMCEIGDMARHYGFDLVALNVNIDTTTPEGKVMLGMMALFSELERDLIAQRTRDALKVKRSQGVRLGTPPVVSSDLVAELAAMRKAGQTFQGIADDLNARGVPTARGGRTWYPATVSSLLNREAEKRVA
jgi:DNA invertase Pin-like site-specific DNA recombinase